MKNRISYQYKHSCSKISFQLKDLFFDTCTYITRCALSSYRVLQDAFPMLQCKLRIYVDMLRAVVLQAGISAPGVRVMGLQSCRICPISHSIYCNTQLYINLGSSRQVYFQTSTKWSTNYFVWYSTPHSPGFPHFGSQCIREARFEFDWCQWDQFFLSGRNLKVKNTEACKVT